MDMPFEMLTNNVAHVKNDGRMPLLHSPQSALDLISDAWVEGGVTRLVIEKKDVSEDFFNPRTGLAHKMLLRFVDYGFEIAIVGDFSTYANKSVCEFIRESNKGNVIHFVDTIDTAVDSFTGVTLDPSAPR